MNRLIIASAVAIVASGVALLACSSTPAYCTAGSTAGTTCTSKFGSCDAGAFGGVNPCASSKNCTNTSGCTTAYNACNTTDQNILTAEANCFTNAPTCTPGNELTWIQGIGACAADAGTPSTSCTSSFPGADGGSC
jgi:hypothetical protein